MIKAPLILKFAELKHLRKVSVVISFLLVKVKNIQNIVKNIVGKIVKNKSIFQKSLLDLD